MVEKNGFLTETETQVSGSIEIGVQEVQDLFDSQYERVCSQAG